MACPRCNQRLALTHDLQSRATKFEYWRCLKHGHFTFLQFLTEKDFVRPLTPKQIAELRQNVQAVNCSNYGIPIDLVTQSACPHCGSPLSMIDMTQIAAHIRELEQAAAAPALRRSSSTHVFNWTLRIGGHTELFRSSSSNSAPKSSVVPAAPGARSLTSIVCLRGGCGDVCREWIEVSGARRPRRRRPMAQQQGVRPASARLESLSVGTRLGAAPLRPRAAH